MSNQSTNTQYQKLTYSESFTPIISFLGLVLFGFIFYYHSELLKISLVDDTYLLSGTDVHEYRWRIIWGLSSVFLFFVIAVNVALSCYIIHRNLSRPNQSLNFLVPLIIFSVIVLIFIFSKSFREYGISGGAGVMLLDAVCQHLGIDLVDTIDWSMIFSIACVLITVASMATILSKPRRRLNVEDILERFRLYKASVYATTLFLAAGILQVYCLYSWSILSYFELDDIAKRSLADTLALSGGIIYTLVFLCMFIPVSVVLSNWSRRLAEIQTQHINPDPEKNLTRAEIRNQWLRDNGLYRSPKKIASNFLILSAPTIIPIIIEIVKQSIS
ncbi:hypothetical protein BFP97_12240 [Roseivirga sp. 4D4]|uniref:hypothetical protein n=1 Tax=Roseivirga sp. 4D4 TaxID=1889784 RepID=UPI0008534B57|nr:hypothetical protein [Roseivirga sp. 4D4]OEK02238.1 hypothetical protein BFP97_12240 [Roseivirga sp. 4D4]